MKRKIILFILILFPFMNGCESVQIQNPFAVFPAQQTEENTGVSPDAPYLAGGATLIGKSERKEMFGTVNEGLSREELLTQVIDYQEQLREEKEKSTSLEKELKNLQTEFGKKIFDMQNQVLACQKSVEDYKEKAAESERKLIKNQQNLDRFRLEVMEKKNAVDSEFPAFYEVQKGDCLWKIAGKKKIYNDPYKWMEIYTENKDKIEEPGILYPGQVLKIPRYYEYLLGSPVKDDLEKSKSLQTEKNEE